MTALIDWSSPLWGVAGSNVHVGSSDDLGKHGARHSEGVDDQ